MSPFEFVNEITFGKKDLFEDSQADKDYIPFIVNREAYSTWWSDANFLLL